MVYVHILTSPSDRELFIIADLLGVFWLVISELYKVNQSSSTLERTAIVRSFQGSSYVSNI